MSIRSNHHLLLRRITPFLINRIRHNSKQFFSSSSSALKQQQQQQQQDVISSQIDTEPVFMTDNCIRRLKELHEKEASSQGKVLRLSVETGGCSGFQYAFLLDDKTDSDDRVFEKEGVKLIVDNVSYDFVKGATVDYVEELIRSAFVFMETNVRRRKLIKNINGLQAILKDIRR
ncbi:hypothetical protein ACHQM5_021191 [Ranunculus cassubicifolius]